MDGSTPLWPPWADNTFDRIQINSGDGDDTINIWGTVKPVTVDAGAVDDTINVGNGNLDDVNVTLTIHGGPSTAVGNTLNVNDQDYGGCPTYTHTFSSPTSGTIATHAAFVLNYDGIENGHLNTANCGRVDIISQSTDPGTLPGGWRYTTGSMDTDIHVGGGPPGTLNFPALNFDSRGVLTSLHLDDRGASPAPDYSVTADTIIRSGTPPITYHNMQSVVLNTAGGSTVNVFSTAAGTPFTVSGAGTVNVGNPMHGVQDILAPLTVINPPWYTTLNVNDCGDFMPRNVTLSVAGPTGTISGLAPVPITYATGDLNALNITTGLGDDVVNVLSTAPGFTVTLDSCGGADTVNVGDASGVQDIRGPLHVRNTPWYTTLNVNDCPDPVARNITLSVNLVTGIGTIAGLAPAPITYTIFDLNALNVTTGLGNDVVNVWSTAPGFMVTLDSCGGADTVNVGDPVLGLHAIQGVLYVRNTPWFTTLNINDCPDPVGQDVLLTYAGPTTGVMHDLAGGWADILFETTDVSVVNITSGTGDDVFHLDPALAAAPWGFGPVPFNFFNCGGFDQILWP
jgi:hypothetical protein